MIRRTILAVTLAFASFFAQAATLTASQMATLKALCQADSTCNGFMTSANDVAMASWFNTQDATFTVWRTNVTDREVLNDPAFDWTRVDNLTVGKARIWDTLFKFGSIDASQANVRAGIDAAWVGTQADLNVRASVYVHCKRLATRAEKALATGTGSNAVPANMTFEGSISYQDASLIRS